MFSLFKKKSIIVPEFKEISNYENKNKYFIRIKKWDWLNSDEIVIYEKDEKSKITTHTVDFWYQEIFLDAKGDYTVKEYLGILANQFIQDKKKIPEDLDVMLIEYLDSLEKELKCIEFLIGPKELDYEFKEPLSKQK